MAQPRVSVPAIWGALAKATTNGDELVVDACDLDCCREDTGTLFDFDRYRRD